MGGQVDDTLWNKAILEGDTLCLGSSPTPLPPLPWRARTPFRAVALSSPPTCAAELPKEMQERNAAIAAKKKEKEKPAIRYGY